MMRYVCWFSCGAASTLWSSETDNKRMEREQNLSRRSFAILLLSTNHWPTLEPNAGAIACVLSLVRFAK
jgi:hypothetical protein